MIGDTYHAPSGQLYRVIEEDEKLIVLRPEYTYFDSECHHGNLRLHKTEFEKLDGWKKAESVT